jgi:hypothetical protein
MTTYKHLRLGKMEYNRLKGMAYANPAMMTDKERYMFLRENALRAPASVRDIAIEELGKYLNSEQKQFYREDFCVTR